MKQIIFILFACAFIGLNAQTSKSFLIRTSLDYNYSKKDALDANSYSLTPTNSNQINNELNLNLSISKIIKSKLYLGIGLSYNRNIYRIEPNINTTGNTLGYIAYSSSSNFSSKTKTLSPLIFIEYSEPLNSKLSFSINFYSKYDFSKTTNELSSYQPEMIYTGFNTFSDIESGSYYSPSYYNSEFETRIENINFGLHPSFRFNIVKNMGLELIFGKIEYKQKTKDSRNNSIEIKTKEFNINFKPKNWMFGFYIEV